MSAPLDCAILRLPHGAELPLPDYATAGAAGLDIAAAVPAGEAMILPSGEWRQVPTGFALHVPAGFEAQVRPRSGLAAKHGVTVLNAPGTIDCDYRGEVKVLLVNHGPLDFEITRGLRIAQLVIAPVAAVRLVERTTLDPSERGAGGFGSTGMASGSPRL